MDIRNLILSNIQMNNKLIPLQFSIADKVKANHFAFVFDEVGCGKTIEAGIAIWEAIKNNAKNVLIVAPTNLTFNWYNEMLSKFGLDFKIVEGRKEATDLYFEGGPYYPINEISNFCIATYDSREQENSNAALDRIKKMDIVWDLIVLDEGHENKNEKTNRYQVLEKYKAQRVVFLSATPIKNVKEDFDKEWELVVKILDNGGMKVDASKFSSFSISAEHTLKFNLNYPVSRNFKEVLLEEKAFKTRTITDIPYEIDAALSDSIHAVYSGPVLDRKKGCIFLYDKVFLKDVHLMEAYKIYKKAQLSEPNVAFLRTIDLKLHALLEKVEAIFKEKQQDKVVIFCNHRAVVDYLKKVFVCAYGSEYVEAIHGESYSIEDRKNRIFLLDKDDSEMDLKKIVILSHNIGSVGINLSKFSHLINYELPDTPADLEQRFGRIDRITNNSLNLSMYFFLDKNGLYDEQYFKRIFNKLIDEVLPVLPSKNLLYSSEKTQQLFKEYILNLLDLESKLREFKSMQPKVEHIAHFLSILKDAKYNHWVKEVKVEHLKLDDEEKINGFIENLNYIVVQSKKLIFSNLGIVKGELNEISQQISQFIYNSIIYNDGGKTVRLNYDQLSERVFNDAYKRYKEKIDSLSKEIQEIQAFVIDLYEKHGLNALLNWVKQQNLNHQILFSVLYSIWTCISKKFNALSFETIIQAYNEGGITIHG